jgi:hypothetical protein
MKLQGKKQDVLVFIERSGSSLQPATESAHVLSNPQRKDNKTQIGGNLSDIEVPGKCGTFVCFWLSLSEVMDNGYSIYHISILSIISSEL